MASLIALHLVGALGGLLFRRMRVPAGSMIGAMLAVILLNLVSGGQGGYPPSLRTLVQICSGMVIGTRFSRKDCRALKTMGIPVGVLLITLFSLNLLFAFLVARLSGLGLITSLFACAPGGVSDLALIASDFGANTDQVAILQVVRFVFVVAFFPPFIRKRFSIREAGSVGAAKNTSKTAPSLGNGAIGLGISLAGALVGGGLLRFLKVPAGAIIGAILVTVVLNLVTDRVYVPGVFKTGIQIGAGCYIGNQITRGVLSSLGGLLIPMLLLLGEVLTMAFLGQWILTRLCRMDRATAMFSCIPGGIAEMSLIAEEMELDLPSIVLMHTCRVIAVICVMPVLLEILTVFI